MGFFKSINISTKVFVGFGCVLALLTVIAAVSLFGLTGADDNFDRYRALARQTNAQGRVQANMLMTRIFAKNFVINASQDNIDGVEQRARNTIQMIAEALELTSDSGYRLILENLGEELSDYVAGFEEVTTRQAERNELVNNTLNVVGPQMERELTQVMESAFNDGDAEAAYRAGIALRNLLLGRLYTQRFLIQNDEVSYRRGSTEFTQMEENLDELVAHLENPSRLELAENVRSRQRVYERAFEDVHSVINTRNEIIENQLDSIGPKVADRVERLKLAIKDEQDALGPRAESEIDQAVALTLTVSVISIGLGVFAAWLIGFGVSRPIRGMADAMRKLAEGNLSVDVTDYDRDDEIGEMADAVQVFRASMIKVNDLAEQQRRAAEELSEARDAADAANKAKSAFLANMSHELRTPMNAILGYSEILIEEAEENDQDEFIPDLKKINEAGEHLLALINDVLDLSKIEAGRMEAFAEEIELSQFVDQVVGTAQPLVVKNGNKFEVQRGEGLGVAHQDVTKLRQALLNMLSNAAKFTREGTVTLTVSRTKESDGDDWLSFAVRDSGIGIPADRIDHVFEEFSQADDSTSREYGGTGLGLPISRRFCQMLGGEMLVESEPGVGSTFTVRVPARLPGATIEKPTEPPEPAEPTERDSSSTALDQIEGLAGGRTVLAIDDNPEALEIIERILVKAGLSVVTASSAEEGLRLAHEVRPSVITLDVVMPDMDGWSVLRALKADPVLSEIPVVMLTMVDDKSQAFALGATDFLTKPVDREQLLRVVERYQGADERRTILIVEDDEPTRDVMARTLAKSDCRVLEASNGREALDHLAVEKPSLILLDLMMPVMDGFDFLLEMRGHPDWLTIPVVVVTAKDLTDEERSALNGRVVEIVAKGAQSHEQVASVIHDLFYTQSTQRDETI
jgi:signal transduction histidine kinase/CheY-like chemotaxis protein